MLDSKDSRTSDFRRVVQIEDVLVDCSLKLTSCFPFQARDNVLLLGSSRACWPPAGESLMEIFG